MTKSFQTRTATALAVVLGLATVLDAAGAAAQSGPPPSGDYGPPPGQYPPPPQDQYESQRGQYPPPTDQYGSDQGQTARPGDFAPPPGQYAPPPPGVEAPGSIYDDRAQRYDYDYGRRYSDWAARYCVERRNDDAVTGAVIGGILGAVIGGGMAGRHEHGEGAVVGGALGATTGALIGSSSQAPGGCPPGLVLRSSAPAFAYEGPAARVFWAPSWYNPWVWSGGAWVYRPYRSWYFTHGDAYWRPGWRPGRFEYRYRRW